MQFIRAAYRRGGFHCFRGSQSTKIGRCEKRTASSFVGTFVPDRTPIQPGGGGSRTLIANAMGLDTVELVMDVEDHFGILLREDESQRIRTIGDLADVILARILASSVTRCPSVRAFYELRRVIRESLGSPALPIRPSTPLVELIPLSQRKTCWASIQSKQPWRFPGLRMVRSTYNFTLALIACVYAIPLCLFPWEMWLISILLSSLVSLIVYSWMKRYRSEIPPNFSTVGDLVKSSVGSVIATKRTDLTTKELVLSDLFPIVAEQFGVELRRLTPQTRFVEDLGAG